MVKMFSLKLFSLFSLIVCLNCDTIEDRLDCWVEKGDLHETECKDRDCVWAPVDGHEGTPWCYFDKNKLGYTVHNSVTKNADGIEADLQLKPTAKKSLKSEQIENLKFSVSYLTENILRFRITDPKNKRYEVPVQHKFPLLQKSPVEKDESKRKYSVEISDGDFHFTITRKETKTKIWDTSIGGLMFTDQFLQIASYLPTKNIYGFGENTHRTLRHDLSYKTWALFGRDMPPGEHDRNLYGVHPFYTCLENDGKSHGILFLNSNAMEYTLLPAPALSLKTAGGILDFFVILGDNPEHVIQLYTSLIGRPVMPPFWGLGFQITRYGYESADHVKKVIDRNVKEKIPMDVHYVDIDYMNQFQDFTYDHKNFAKLPELIADTKRDLNLHWTLILDPAIQGDDPNYDTFKTGYEKDVFIRWPKDVPMAERNNPPNTPTDKGVIYGRVWPRGPAAFPDFFRNATREWWKERASYLYKDLNIKFDGLWIDMNEPANFDNGDKKCPNSKYDLIQTRIKPVDNGRLSIQTICMISVQGEKDEYRHYDVHSLYGWSQTEPTENAVHSVTGKRGFVLSRSTYVSSNTHAGHWLGDNNSQWSHIRHSIIGMLEFSLFGFSWTGADICGFIGDTNPELCKRWHQLGAFYPFSRNHNNKGSGDQDPGVWVEKGHSEVTEAARSSLNVRYTLLLYLYTLFFRAHTLGETLARPVFHEYPKDNNTYGIDQQFFWGRSILVSPFLFQDQKEVNAYLPPDVWYKPTADFVKLETSTGQVKIPDSQHESPYHIRGGSILPIVSKPAVNTKIIRETPIQIEVFPKDKSASGDLFWDDGESIGTIESGKYNYYEFNLHNNCSLEIKVVKHGFDSESSQKVDRILIANTNSGEIEAHIDGKAISSPVVKEDYIALPVDINLGSKKTGEKWVIDWSLKSGNKCNLK